VKIAALDLGSNTFLCLIAEVNQGKVEKVFYDGSRVVRLGQGLAKSKQFHPEALSRAKSCLEDFKVEINNHKPQKIVAVATAAARDAANAEELFKIGRDLGINIEIIEGSKEAQITFLGGTSGVQLKENLVLIDIGGGSTEIIVGMGSKMEFSKSTNIGCVKTKELFFEGDCILDEKSLNKAKDYLADQLREAITSAKNASPQIAIAVAGTPTTLGAVINGKFEAEKIDNMRISLAQLDDWTKRLSVCTSTQIANNWNVEPGRADVLVPGLIILSTVITGLGLKEFYVSTRGVRYGVAIENGY
jgi:exopolyphosphatase / guanosine-5'-triphosphate,3'-diphosphate pyrophosphatase